jgi:hypothetical protein
MNSRSSAVSVSALMSGSPSARARAPNHARTRLRDRHPPRQILCRRRLPCPDSKKLWDPTATNPARALSSRFLDGLAVHHEELVQIANRRGRIVPVAAPRRQDHPHERRHEREVRVADWLLPRMPSRPHLAHEGIDRPEVVLVNDRHPTLPSATARRRRRSATRTGMRAPHASHRSFILTPRCRCRPIRERPDVQRIVITS